MESKCRHLGGQNRKNFADSPPCRKSLGRREKNPSLPQSSVLPLGDSNPSPNPVSFCGPQPQAWRKTFDMKTKFCSRPVNRSFYNEIPLPRMFLSGNKVPDCPKMFFPKWNSCEILNNPCLGPPAKIIVVRTLFLCYLSFN